MAAANTPKGDRFPENRRDEDDAGAAFVLESKGNSLTHSSSLFIYIVWTEQFFVLSNQMMASSWIVLMWSEVYTCFASSWLIIMSCFILIEYRWMVARGFSLNDGDRRANDTDAAVRVQRNGMGSWGVLPHCDGCRHFLLLLPYVEGAWTLRKLRSPPHPFPGTRRRRLRWLLLMQPWLVWVYRIKGMFVVGFDVPSLRIKPFLFFSLIFSFL